MTTKHQKRRGAAAIIAMVLILIIGTLAATTIKGIYRDRSAFRHDLVRQQTERLIDDAVVRTALKLETQPDYAGETVSFGDIPLPMPGTLDISIEVAREEENITVTGVFVEQHSNRKICDIKKTADFSGIIVVEEPFVEQHVQKQTVGSESDEDFDDAPFPFGGFDDDPFALSDESFVEPLPAHTLTSIMATFLEDYFENEDTAAENSDDTQDNTPIPQGGGW